MRKTITLLALIACVPALQAQDVPLYLHTFNNMYLQNPATAGIHEYGVVYATLHKQLIGSFADAPEHASVSFNTPLGNGRTGIGANVYQFRRSILKTTGALFTIAQQVDFGKDHNLRLGISAGFADNFINLSAIDNPSDPALLNRINNKIIIDGQVGIYYRLAGFALGASLPKLFKYYGFANPNNPAENIYPLQNYILSASYKLKLGTEVSLQPLVFYRKYEKADPTWEANATLSYKETVWAGATYRTDYGAAVIAGVRAGQRFSFSYAYKLANTKPDYYSNPAHEFQVGIFFGSKARKVADVPQEPDEPVAQVPAPPLPKPQPITQPDTAKKKQEPIAIPSKPEQPVKEDIRVGKQGDHPKELSLKYYVVIGSFVVEKNAKAYVSQLNMPDRKLKVGYNSGNGRYQVYIFETPDRATAVTQLFKTRTDTRFPSAWILKVEK